MCVVCLKFPPRNDRKTYAALSYLDREYEALLQLPIAIGTQDNVANKLSTPSKRYILCNPHMFALLLE